MPLLRGCAPLVSARGQTVKQTRLRLQGAPRESLVRPPIHQGSWCFQSLSLRWSVSQWTTGTVTRAACRSHARRQLQANKAPGPKASQFNRWVFLRFSHDGKHPLCALAANGTMLRAEPSSRRWPRKWNAAHFPSMRFCQDYLRHHVQLYKETPRNGIRII